jgi:hypothetical protein
MHYNFYINLLSTLGKIFCNFAYNREVIAQHRTEILVLYMFITGRRIIK